MGVILGLVFWLIGLIITIVILQWIITSAIDNSRLTKELIEIKELLRAQNNGNLNETQEISNLQYHNFERNMSDKSMLDKCPGCGETVHISDDVCNSCGLTLSN